MLEYEKLSLEDLQGLRDKSKGNQLKAVKDAIDHLFLPPKPRKKRKQKDRKRRFTPLY